MGILDDAIREHLELKRQHGAAETELEQLEGEAFGPPERPGSEQPDPLAEAPTEFMAQPDAPEGQPAEASDAPKPEAADAPAQEAPEQPPLRQERAAEIGDLQEAPEPEAREPEPEQETVEPPSELPPEPIQEEAPAMEHKAVTEPEPPQGPTTEERQAIADPPTELYDVEGEEFGAEAQAPSDEELVEEEIEGEPRLAPEEPMPSLDEVGIDIGEESDITISEGGTEEEEEDSFFDQKRLSDELDQALDVPIEDEVEDSAFEEEPPSEEEPAPEETPAAEPRSEEDVLEETPDFLEEAPEDDQLWFEQKPPKDFDFDD